MSHSRTVCIHDKLISQCRCPAPNKRTIIGECQGDHTGLPVVYGDNAGEVTGGATLSDKDALIALIKRISPIRHEPLATAVAEEWAQEFIKEGWHR